MKFEVNVVVLAVGREFEGDEILPGDHTRVGVCSIASVVVGDTDTGGMFLVTFVEKHGSSQCQRIGGVVSRADISNNLVYHALEDGGTGLSGQNLHLLLGLSLRPIMSDRSHGARVVKVLDSYKGHDVRVHVNTTSRMEGTESEQISTESRWSQALVGRGSVFTTVFADEVKGFDITKVTAFISGVRGRDTNLGKGWDVVGCNRVQDLWDSLVRGARFTRFVILTDEGQLQIVLAHLAVFSVVHQLGIDLVADTIF